MRKLVAIVGLLILAAAGVANAQGRAPQGGFIPAGVGNCAPGKLVIGTVANGAPKCASASGPPIFPPSTNLNMGGFTFTDVACAVMSGEPLVQGCAGALLSKPQPLVTSFGALVNSNPTAGGLAFQLPRNLTTGNVELAIVGLLQCTPGTVTINPSSGTWALVSSAVNTGNASLYVYSHAYSSSDTATIFRATWTGGNCFTEGRVEATSSTAGTQLDNAFSAVSSGSVSTLALPGGALANSGDTVLAWAITSNGTIISLGASPPAGITQTWTSFNFYGLSEWNYPEATATAPTVNFNAALSSYMAAIQVGLIPQTLLAAPCLQGDPNCSVNTVTATNANIANLTANANSVIDPMAPGYGALCNGVNDDTIPLQKALNDECVAIFSNDPIASQVGAGGVYIPGGTCNTSRPIIARCPLPTNANAFEFDINGPSRSHATIAAQGRYPVVAAYPSNYVTSFGVPLAAAPLVGSGTCTATTINGLPSYTGPCSMNFGPPPTAAYYDILDMLTTGTVSPVANCFNPLYNTSWTIEGYGFLNAAASGQNDITNYATSNGGGFEGSSSLEMELTPGSPASFNLTTSAGTQTVTPGANIAVGTLYYFRMSWDGTNLWGYSGAPGGTLTAAEGALAGTFSPTAYATWLLGSQVQDAFYDNINGNHSFYGQLYSIRIDTSANSPTSSITAPSAPLTADGSTIYLNNGSNFYDAFVQSDVPLGSWDAVRNIGFAGGANISMHDVALSGGSWGMQIFQAPGFNIKNIDSIGSARGGFEFWNNDFFSEADHINVLFPTCGQEEISDEWGISSLTNTQTSQGGGYEYKLAGGNVTNAKTAVASGEISAFLIKPQSVFAATNISASGCDAENGGVADCVQVFPVPGGTINFNSFDFLAGGAGLRIFNGSTVASGEQTISLNNDELFAPVIFDKTSSSAERVNLVSNASAWQAGVDTNHDAWLDRINDPVYGAKPRTFAGAAGTSDTIVSCTLLNNNGKNWVTDGAATPTIGSSYAPAAGSGNNLVSCRGTTEATTTTGDQTFPEGTVTVGSTAGFASSGTISIGPSTVGTFTVQYTGLGGGGTTFTGVTGFAGPSSTVIPGGTAVNQGPWVYTGVQG